MDCILSAKSSEVNDAFSSRSIANNREFTLEEIIHSMSGHLQHAHADSSQHGLEDLCEMKRNKENIDPTRVKHTDATHDGWLLKSKPECQVPPLNLDEPVEDFETEIELNTPRLNNALFQKLKKKYPRAFRRRSSAFSETSSVCSLSSPGTPRTPRRLSVPTSGHDNVDSEVDNTEGIPNTNTDDTFENSGFEHSSEDLTLSGISQNSAHPFTEDFDMNSISRFQSKSRTYVVTPKGTEHRATEKDTKLSLKERLQRNKKNLRELLDEKYPFKNRSLTVFSGTPGSIPKEELEVNAPFTDTSGAQNISPCASKPPKPNQHHSSSKILPNAKVSLHDTKLDMRNTETTRYSRTLEKGPVPEYVKAQAKRFSSPDSAGSTHDSAVDMDSASLQSSPSSSDHNHSPGQNTPEHSSQTNTRTCQPLPRGPSRYAPKLKSRRSAPSQSEAVQSSLPTRDSDTDSGIGAHSYPTQHRRLRYDSGSSVETEIDMFGGTSFGRRFSPKPLRNLKLSGNRVYSSNNSSPREGPVKADYKLQAPSPRHNFRRDEADEDIEMWYRQGVHPKMDLMAGRTVSVDDFSRTDSLNNRVHFNDAVDYNEELEPWYRTLSPSDPISKDVFQFGVPPRYQYIVNDNGATETDIDFHDHRRSPGKLRERMTLGHGIKKDFSPDNNLGWDNMSQSNYSSASGPELAHEIGYYSKLYDDINNKSKVKKSKKPWKRNKAKFIPGDYNETGTNLVKASSVGDISQSKGYTHKTGKTQSGEIFSSSPGNDGPDDNIPSSTWASGADENPYEELSHIKRKVPPVKPPRPHKNRSSGHGLYASVDKGTRDGRKKMYSSNPCITQDMDESINVEELPPVPTRGYTSDLDKYSDISESRSSLFERMNSAKKTARKGLSRLRRAISLERVDNSDDEGQMKKSSSIRSLKDKLPFRRKSTDSSGEKQRPNNATASRPPRPKAGGKINKKYSSSMTALDSVDSPTHFRPIGKLLHMNPDGSRVLELNKPPHGPFGFYIARGNAKYNHGIFISRLSDSLPASFFASLMAVGDEILEINQQKVRSLTMEHIHAMIASNNRLILKTLPFLARQDV